MPHNPYAVVLGEALIDLLDSDHDLRRCRWSGHQVAEA
jgi:hypothetical protein